MLLKCCTQYISKIGKPSNFQATGLEKVILIPQFILIPKKGSTKEHSNFWTIALTSHASKVMHRILQAKLQQYFN